MNRIFRKSLAFLALVVMLAFAAPVLAQNTVPNGVTPVTLGNSTYTLIPISATAAVNNQVTLTIPAPTNAQFSNYVCYLGFNASQDGTATVQTNAVTTSTNFNSFALKYSLTATATINYSRDFYWGTPGAGCVKSTLAGTATTFVSPGAGTNIAFTWQAAYFQAP